MNDNPVLSKLTFNKRTKRYDYKGNLTREEIESLLEINKCRFIVKLGKIDGDFDCSYNKLISLEGAPKYIGGNFYYEQTPNLDPITLNITIKGEFIG